MLRQLRPALIALALLGALTGLAYPLAVTGIAQVVMDAEADGSEISIDGQVVGSSLIAQPFEGMQWFHPRPSAVDHDASASGGSNLGPTNPELLAAIEQRAARYRKDNGLSPGTAVPVDAVTASGSGLDPHISERNAHLQAPRVAASRAIAVDEVLALIAHHTEPRTARILGESRVNVVNLNADLERLAR